MADDVKAQRPEPPVLSGPSGDAAPTKTAPAAAAATGARRPRRWVLVVAGLALFLSGGVLGAAASLWGLRRAVLRGIHNPRQIPEVLAARLRSKLDLSAAQEAQVREILKRRQESLIALRREVQPRLEAELDAVRAEIGAVLDEGQRRRWFERFDEMRGRWIPPVPPPIDLPGEKR